MTQLMNINVTKKNWPVLFSEAFSRIWDDKNKDSPGIVHKINDILKSV